MELSQQEKKIIKKFISELGKVYNLEEYQIVRKIGRYLSLHDSTQIIKLLYKIIREEGSR